MIYVKIKYNILGSESFPRDGRVTGNNHLFFKGLRDSRTFWPNIEARCSYTIDIIYLKKTCTPCQIDTESWNKALSIVRTRRLAICIGYAVDLPMNMYEQCSMELTVYSMFFPTVY